MLLRINLGGFHGVGKTTLSHEIANLYLPDEVQIIPRYTSRPLRLNEDPSWEYVFISEEKFQELFKEDFFILGTVRHFVRVNGEPYSTGIPHIQHWPVPQKRTKIVLSMFGTKAYLVRREVPNMVLVFVSLDIPTLRERIIERCQRQGIDPLYKLTMIASYTRRREWLSGHYDFVVKNDSTPKICAQEIVKKSIALRKSLLRLRSKK